MQVSESGEQIPPRPLPSSENVYVQIVDLLTRGDPQGVEQGSDLLYRTFQKGLRYLAARHCPEYVDDVVQDTILIAIRQVSGGQLQTPEALPGYIHMILKRTAWNKKLEARRDHGLGSEVYEVTVQTKACDAPTPEATMEKVQRIQLMKDLMRTMKPLDQEILTRFYLNHQTQEQICTELKITPTQFRLRKNRAKDQLAAITTKKVINKRPPLLSWLKL